MYCLEQCSDLKEHEMLLHLLRYFLEQPGTKICDDLSCALKDTEILKQFIDSESRCTMSRCKYD